MLLLPHARVGEGSEAGIGPAWDERQQPAFTGHEPQTLLPQHPSRLPRLHGLCVELDAQRRRDFQDRGKAGVTLP